MGQSDRHVWMSIRLPHVLSQSQPKMTGQIHSCWKIHMVGRYLLSARDFLGSGVFSRRVAQFGTRRGRSVATGLRVGPSSELARQQPQGGESVGEPSRGWRPSGRQPRSGATKPRGSKSGAVSAAFGMSDLSLSIR